LIPQTEVVVIETTSSVSDAMLRLADARVLSAPLVMGVLQSVNDGRRYQVLAFISVRDVLRSFVDRAREAAPLRWPMLHRMAALSALGAAFGQEQIISLHVVDDGDMLYSNATRTTTLMELVRTGFLRGPRQHPAVQPRHRIGVFNSSGCITDIISQSDIVAWLHELGPKALGPITRATVADLGLSSGQRVVTVPATMPTDQALSVLVAHNVSAVAVLDAATGFLVAALSEADFRGCRPHDFGSLALPVAEWMAHTKGVSIVHDSIQHTLADPWARALFDARVAISLSASATLFQVMETLVLHRIHRVFILDTAPNALLSVISHTDVLTALLHQHKPETP